METTEKTAVRTMPKVTVRQVSRFYKVMCAVGLDDYVQAAFAAAQPQSARRPVTAEQQKGAGDSLTDDQLAAVTAKLNFGRMVQVFGFDGQLEELTSIVTGCTVEEAGGVTIDELADFFPGFVAESLRPIMLLLGFGTYIGQENDRRNGQTHSEQSSTQSP